MPYVCILASTKSFPNSRKRFTIARRLTQATFFICCALFVHPQYSDFLKTKTWLSRLRVCAYKKCFFLASVSGIICVLSAGDGSSTEKFCQKSVPRRVVCLPSFFTYCIKYRYAQERHVYLLKMCKKVKVLKENCLSFLPIMCFFFRKCAFPPNPFLISKENTFPFNWLKGQSFF